MERPLVVLITGAYGGIGRAVCECYLEQASALVITGRDPIKLNQLAEQLSVKSQTTILAIAADINEESQVMDLFKQINQSHKGLDLLVHCAGSLLQKPLMMTRYQEMQQEINTNLLSSLLFCQQASRLMARKKRGVITLMSSIVAQQGSSGQSVYAAAKAGIEGLVKSLAKEFGGLGIRINALAPGVIDTDLVKHLDETARQGLQENTALKRLGEVQDITPVVTFLSSPGAAYITGQVIAVDGGLVL